MGLDLHWAFCFWISSNSINDAHFYYKIRKSSHKRDCNDPPSKDGNAQFTSEPLKALSDEA